MRDAGTARHSQTVGRYCELIAAEMGLDADHGRARAARRAAARRRQHRDLEHAAEQAGAARAPTSGRRSAATPRSARASSRTRGSATSANGSSRTTSASTASGFPLRPRERVDPARGAHPGGRRRLRGDDVRAPAPRSAQHEAGDRRSCSATPERSSTRTSWTRCCEHWRCATPQSAARATAVTRATSLVQLLVNLPGHLSG